MTDKMTPERLEEIEAVAQAATPGPWSVETSLSGCTKIKEISKEYLFSFETAYFLANARIDISLMSLEIRRCWAEIEKMGKMIDWLNKMISARGCTPPVLRPPERIPCPGGISCEACWREAAERAVSE